MCLIKSCMVNLSPSMNTSTSEAGGCHCAGIALCSSRTRATRNTVCQLREDCYLPPVNGPLDGILSCSPISSSFSWFLTYSAIRLSFFPTVSPSYPLHPNSRLRYLYFNSPNCSYSIVLPFRLYDSYLFPLAQLPQYLPYCCFLFFVKYFPAVLRRKYNMIFAIPSRMR